MFSPKADAPLVVRVPTPAEDRPSWMKVGVITAIGFIAGVAWPRLAGVRLGPAVPDTGSASAVASSETPAPMGSERGAAHTSTAGTPAAPPNAPATAPVVVATPAPTAAAPSLPTNAASVPVAAAAPPSGAVNVTVGHGAVFACKSAEGDSLKGGAACGTLPGLDNLLIPRLRKLADCPDAAMANGVFHLIVHPDFSRGTVGVELGRGQGVGSPDALLACAKSDLAGAGGSIAGIPHDNPRYSVSYRLNFGAAGAAAPAPPAERADTPPAPAVVHATRPIDDASGDGAAQVVWDVALVRDSPKTGKVVARLPKGTAVRIGSVKDGWYPVKYGDGFSAGGWIFRSALGK
jgi:hypothetical protein